MEYLNNLSNKTVAVLGMGYIGSHLIKLLKKLQDSQQFTLFEINRKNIDLLKQLDFDYVFNCAGNTGNFRQEPIKTVESNIHLNTFLLKHCEIKESLVCLSSTRIYGFSNKNDSIFTEDFSTKQDHLLPDALYDNAKKMMESVLLNTPRSYKKVVLRLSNVFGRYESNDLDDSTFLKLLLRYKCQNKILKTDQNRNSTKDYIFIDDALNGILRAGILSPNNAVYNIASGKSCSIDDWARFLELKIDMNALIGHTNAVYSNISNEKARTEIGFQTMNNLENLSLSEIINYE